MEMMRIRKTAGWILIAVGASLAAWTAVGWQRAGKDIGENRARMAEKTAELQSTRKELNAAGLLYIAYQKSVTEMPDSVAKQNSKLIGSERKRHKQVTWRLEAAERDLKIDLKQLKRRDAEARAARKEQALPTAAGAAGAIVCGAFCLLTARPRREAA
jgi:hypothetical protein